MFDNYRKLFLFMLIFSIRRKYNEHSMSSDGVLNSLVGRVQKEIDWFVVKVKCGISRVIRFIMVMKTKQIDTKPKNWEWTSKQELVQAIEELNILSDDDLVSDISKTEKQWNLKRVKHRRELIRIGNMVKNEGRIKEAIAYYSWRNVNLEKTFGQEYLIYKSKINIYIL